MLAGMLCTSILFTGLLGGIKASASEIDSNLKNEFEYLESVNILNQTRAGLGWSTITTGWFSMPHKPGKNGPIPVAQKRWYVMRTNGIKFEGWLYWTGKIQPGSSGRYNSTFQYSGTLNSA